MASTGSTQTIKLQIEAGKATPAPPIGTVLGPTGINMGEFCTQFNAATQATPGELVSVVLHIKEDRSFDFVIKSPPASFLIRKAAGVDKGSGKNAIKKVGKISQADVRAIAEKKMQDLNARNLEAAEESIRGTARSMGIEVQ